MKNDRKEAMLHCLKTGEYTPYKLPESKLPVSGCFWLENNEIKHRDLEVAMGFNSNGKGKK